MMGRMEREKRMGVVELGGMMRGEMIGGGDGMEGVMLEVVMVFVLLRRGGT